MIVSGVVADGSSVELLVSLQEFKDLYILLDLLTNADAEGYDLDLSGEVVDKVQAALEKDNMGYHNDQEIFTLLHAFSILMRPLAYSIVPVARGIQSSAMQNAGADTVQ